MNTTELLAIFATFTKENWQSFDTLKSIAFQPTKEEIDLETQRQAKLKKDTIKAKLSAIGVVLPETITKEFVLQFLEMIQAQQFVGSDLEKWIDNQIELFGDIETAFNELVFSHL